MAGRIRGLTGSLRGRSVTIVAHRSFGNLRPVGALAALAIAVFSYSGRADIVGSVTVEGQRDPEKIESVVDTFVSSAMRRPGSESLLRWDSPVCPLAAGLNREAGEFVLRRLSRIAVNAHVPLGPEDCRPNLFVIVAKQPEQFLKLWWRKNPRLFDTRYGIAPVRKFIETPRPVRVWYNAGITGAEQASLFSGMLQISNQTFINGMDYPVYATPSLNTRLKYPVVRALTSAIVVVDSGKVSRLNMGQLVDYVGMIGFAEINLDNDVGEAPTILKVFAAAETPQPIEMSDWDRALLYSLYTTQQQSRTQLSNMQTSMVKQLVSRNAP